MAATFATIMAFSTVPTPLYALYQRRDHFTTVTITVVFAAFALGVLVSLYLAGHLSDRFGRRGLILASLVLQLASTAVFLTRDDVAGLIAARIVNGLGVGILTATATAYLGDLDAALHGRPTRAAVAVTGLANLGGLGSGALASAFIAEYLPDPLVTPYAIFGVLLLVEVAAVVLVAPETVERPDPRPRYRPQRVAVPRDARGVFWAAAFASLAAFSVFGLFTALSPSFVRGVLHLPSLVASGAVAFSVFGAAAGAQAALVSLTLRAQLRLALVCSVAGLALLAAGAILASLPVFVLGAVGAGAGAGLAFRSSLGTASALTTPDRRGEVLAGVFLTAYVGISIPVVLIGAALQVWGMQTVLVVFAGLALALFAWALLRMLRRTSAVGDAS